MTDRPKSIVEALAEVQRKVNEQRAKRLANMMEAVPAVAPSKPERFKGSISDFQKANPGATVGQAMNAIQGKTAITGGKNDPTVISAQREKDSAAGPTQPTFIPKAGTVMRKGEVAGQVADRNTEPGFSGNAGAMFANELKNSKPTGAPTGSQSPEGHGNVEKGVTAAPVAPASSGEKGVAAATAISNTDRAIENNARSGTSSQLSGKPLDTATGSNATPAQFINANRGAGAAGGTTMGSARQLGTIAAAGDAGKAGDDSARSSMSTDQKAKIDSDAASRQSSMNAEREKNLADQAAKRATPSSDSPSMFSKVKDFFTKPTETKVSDSGIEPESGPKGKKKMSESALISAFLKLQETNHPNIFEAAKKVKKDYDGDGKIESGKDEYLGSRIAAAKKAGKMEEELKGNQKKIDANNNGKIDGDDFRKLRSGKKSEKMKAYRADRDKHGEMEEAAYPPGVSGKDTAKDKDPDMLKGSPDDEAAEKKIPTPLKKPAEMKEETFPGFSESEIAHFEAVIARKDQKGKDKGPGDVVASEDLTDEYINEMAQRGVKAGTKRGSYKGKAHKGGADAKGDSMPDEGPKGVPHVLDQIRHGREDEHGFKTITHPASSPEAPVSKAIHRSELHGFYDQYHNTEKPAAKEKAYAGFLGKHFGDERTNSPTSQSVTTDLSKIEKSNLKGGSKVSLGGSKLVGGKK
jgi:hypothetical protein